MSVNGMAVLLAVRQAFPDIFVTETHPKVLCYALLEEPLRLQRAEHIRHERPPELMARCQSQTSDRARMGRRHLDPPDRPWTPRVMAGPARSADRFRRTPGAPVRRDDLHVAQTEPHSTYPRPSASPATRPITSSFSLTSASISSLGTCRASTWKLFFGMTFGRASLSK